MDLTPTASTHTLDTDTQSPPHTQPTNTSKSLSFTNGSLKRHHPTTAPPPPPPSPSMVVYKECLKNHAASIGGHALDGCGEFMPSSNPSTQNDPHSLKCAACRCHRNFHRRDTQEFTNPNSNFLPRFYPPPPLPHRGFSQSTSPSLSSSPSPSPSPISSPSSPSPISHLPPNSYSYNTSAPHMLLVLGTGTPNFNSSVMKLKIENPSGKNKRYRTKFSQEQKQMMYSFSEKLGWRMQNGDDVLIQEFCNDIGVSRGVFKVWMHNNKNTSRKRSELVGLGNAQIQNDHKINEHNGNDGRGGFDR